MWSQLHKHQAAKTSRCSTSSNRYVRNRQDRHISEVKGASFEEKLEILKKKIDEDLKRKRTDVAKELGLPPSTLSTIVDQRDQTMQNVKRFSVNTKKAKAAHNVKLEEVLLTFRCNSVGLCFADNDCQLFFGNAVFRNLQWLPHRSQKLSMTGTSSAPSGYRQRHNDTSVKSSIIRHLVLSFLFSVLFLRPFSNFQTRSSVEGASTCVRYMIVKPNGGRCSG